MEKTTYGACESQRGAASETRVPNSKLIYDAGTGDFTTDTGTEENMQKQSLTGLSVCLLQRKLKLVLEMESVVYICVSHCIIIV